MTVNVEHPRIEYVGTGINTEFAFLWSSGDPNENYVTVNDILQTEGIEYELEDYTGEFGGRMVFYVPPAAGADVVVYRKTPITQQVDYVEGDAFPADTHEFQMDKDTRILQELRVGGQDTGSSVDLTAIPQATGVLIDNSAGTDAFITPWTTDGLLAGVALGEVIPAGDPVPEDGSPSTKPDGYVWYVLEALP